MIFVRSAPTVRDVDEGTHNPGINTGGINSGIAEYKDSSFLEEKQCSPLRQPCFPPQRSDLYFQQLHSLCITCELIHLASGDRLRHKLPHFPPLCVSAASITALSASRVIKWVVLMSCLTLLRWPVATSICKMFLGGFKIFSSFWPTRNVLKVIV